MSNTKERPILFSGEMVRAILDGRKTMTRRVVKLQPNNISWHPVQLGRYDGWQDEHGNAYPCPYGQAGDLLWVRETHYVQCCGYQDGTSRDIRYRADGNGDPVTWTPSIHMPRWASRITLEVAGVRMQRLQEISEKDALAEGITHHTMNDPRVEFQWLWDSINAKHGFGWDVNPWVWIVEFRRVTA